MPIQPLNTTAIEARLAAATKGPWKATNKNRGVMLDSPSGPVIDLQPHEKEVMDIHHVNVRIFDMDLIEHAPADLRALVDEVRELRELVKDAYEEGYADADVTDGRDMERAWLTSTTRARLQGDA